MLEQEFKFCSYLLSLDVMTSYPKDVSGDPKEGHRSVPIGLRTALKDSNMAE